MKQVNVMLKPASSLCNFRCRYCFYSDVSHNRGIGDYGLMSHDVAGALIRSVYNELEEGDCVNFGFQGGEPTLAGLEFYESFIEMVKANNSRVKASYAFQTNGVLLDDTWCAFFKKHNFLVGLSLDCGKGFHDMNRLDGKGLGSFGRVMEAKRILDKHKVEYNILSVLTNESARHPQAIWKFMLREGIKYIQFIPCLNEFGSDESKPWVLTPKRFYQFYTTLYLLWENELKKNNYISVKLFDDIANLTVRRTITSCGLHGQCHRQIVVEADGGIYPCDFYALDEYLLGNIADVGLWEVFESAAEADFLANRKSLPETCGACSYFQICGGGCKRMEHIMYVDKDGFCGYQHFLADRLDALYSYCSKFI